MYVVSGHTPTQLIEKKLRIGFIYQKNHHIAIDCGACFPDGIGKEIYRAAEADPGS